MDKDGNNKNTKFRELTKKDKMTITQDFDESE